MIINFLNNHRTQTIEDFKRVPIEKKTHYLWTLKKEEIEKLFQKELSIKFDQFPIKAGLQLTLEDKFQIKIIRTHALGTVHNPSELNQKITEKTLKTVEEYTCEGLQSISTAHIQLYKTQAHK